MNNLMEYAIYQELLRRKDAYRPDLPVLPEYLEIEKRMAGTRSSSASGSRRGQGLRRILRGIKAGLKH